MHPYLIRIPLPWGGGLTIASYGFMILCGFLLSLHIVQRRSRRAGVDPNAMFDVAIAALIGGIVGARLFYVVYAWPVFRANPIEIIRIDRGGLVFFGGLAGGGVAMLITLLRRRIPLRRALDLAMSVVPLGHAFGRLGCFLNGCCFGRVTWSWLGMPFPRIVDAETGQTVGSPVFIDHVNRELVSETAQWSLPVHPTQLYEAGYNLLIFAVLSLFLWRRRREGDVAWLYGVLYGSARFLNEFVRADQDPLLSGLTVAQLICVPLVLFGIVMLVRSSKLPREPFAEPWRPTEEAAAGQRQPAR